MKEFEKVTEKGKKKKGKEKQTNKKQNNIMGSELPLSTTSGENLNQQ